MRATIPLCLVVVATAACALDPVGGPDEETPLHNQAPWQPIGWDPGFHIPRGVSISMAGETPPYSICPLEPGGVCDGLAQADGWYNLAGGMDWHMPVAGGMEVQHAGCVPSPHGTPGDGAAVLPDMGDPAVYRHTGVRCPFYFDWTADEEGMLANMTVDTRSYRTDLTPNNYFGIQRNIQGPRGGMQFDDPAQAPPLDDVDYIRFRYRASVCDPRDDGWYFGRGVYYLSLWNPDYPNPVTGELGFGMELSVNFAEYLRGVDRQTASGALVIGVRPQTDLAPGPEVFANTWHIEGRIIPQFLHLDGGSYDLARDPSCSPFAGGGWTTVTIAVKQLIEHLASTVAGFPADPALYSGARYAGGIVGGVEMWGRGTINFQYRDHTLYHDPAAAPLFEQGPGSELAGLLGREARCPFDAGHYLATNPDLPAAGVFLAVEHYLAWGVPEGRAGGCPPGNLDAALAEAQALQADPLFVKHFHLNRFAACPFDAGNYLTHNPDLAPAGITWATAVGHYLQHGIREGRPGGCPPSRADLPGYL